MAYAVYRRFTGETFDGHVAHWNRVYKNGKPYRIPTLEEANAIASEYTKKNYDVKIKEVK